MREPILKLPTLKKLRNYLSDEEMSKLDMTPYVRVSAEDIKWATDYLTEGDQDFTIEINADELAEDLYYKED